MTSVLASEGVGPGYRPDVDGLRAVAVTAVVAHHAWPGILPGGFFGVDVFFVISGFLITGILRREAVHGPAGLVNFYARRVRRILPALAVMTAAVLAFGLAALIPHDLDLLGQSAASAASLSSNRFFLGLTGYFSPDATLQPLLHTWSLSIEEQFYLGWPLALLVLFHPRLRRIAPWLIAALAILSFAESARLSALGGVDEAFYYLRSRLWELLLGGLLALAPLDRLAPRVRAGLGLAGLAAIGIGLSPIGGAVAWPGPMALLPCLGAALVIAAQGEGIAGRLLSSRPAVALGLISYSLYLWHWPLLSLPQLVLSRPLTPGEATLAVAAAAALAWGSWRWVERPFRRAGAVEARRAIAVGLATLVVGWGAGALLAKTQGLTGRAAPGVLAAQAAAEAPADLTCHNGGGTAIPPRAACTTGPATGGLVVLWGDSHAAHLAPLVRAAAGLEHRVRQVTKSSCPPVDLPGSDSGCAAFNRAVAEDLAREGPVTVVLSGRWTEYLRRDGRDLRRFETRMADGLADLRRTLGPDVRLVVWGPTPEFDFEPSMCWARAAQARLDVSRCETPPPRDATLTEAAGLALTRAAEGWAEVVLPFSALCSGKTCAAVAADGTFRFRDDDHLTESGARGLARLLAGRL